MSSGFWNELGEAYMKGVREKMAKRKSKGPAKKPAKAKKAKKGVKNKIFP